MECQFFLLIVAVYWVGVSVGEHSVSILTDPSQGPFRIGQTVQFSCVVEPTPCEPVDYQWRTVDSAYGGSSRTQQNFSRSYHIYDFLPRYCYYLCKASVNGTLLGSTSRIVEVQGLLFTEEAVVHSFTYGGSLELNVNRSNSYFARYINSLVWYHNGTEIVSGTKYSISNNGTRLRITNMAGSDAGSYEVKIGSISYNGEMSSPICDSMLLPLLEFTAEHAPVTFTVQEGRVPSYDLSSIVTILSVINDVGMLELRAPILRDLNTSLSISYIGDDWYRNGVRLSDGSMFNSTASLEEGLSLQIQYNNTDDIIGDYVGILWMDYYYIDNLRSMCRVYYNYFDDRFYIYIILSISFWKIQHQVPPSSVVLHFEVSVLSVLETTTVECTAVGGGPSETFNLTLWRNEEPVASGNGRNLSHMITPSQYGTYRCSVGSIDSTISILKERAPLQVLMGEYAPSSLPLCLQDEGMIDIKTALSKLLGQLCQTCDPVSAGDIVDVNCTVLGRSTHLTASLVYSTPDGRITASTLLNMLTVWLLAEDNPTLMVAGTPVTLSKQCPIQLNDITRNCGIQWLNSDHPTASTSIPSTSTPSTAHTPASCEAPHAATVITVGGVFAGLVAGIVAAVIAVFIIVCVLKVRSRHTPAAAVSQPLDTGKIADIPLDANQAYESVDTRYQAGVLGRMQEADEVIYEQPTV